VRCLQSQNLKNNHNLGSATNNIMKNLVGSVGLGISRERRGREDFGLGMPLK
jgi:hypothetical protein